MKYSIILNLALRNGSAEKVKEVFTSIYNDYFKIGVFLAKQYLEDDDAIDVAEDVFVSFYETVINEKKCEIKNIKQYLCTSIKNNAIKVSNDKKKYAYLNEEAYQEQEIEDDHKEEIEELNQVFEELDKIEQYIIVEHAIFDKSLVGIAKEMNKSKNTIKSIYYRAIIKLRKELTWIRKK